MESSTRQHWDSIYKIRSEEELSWFQAYPKTSMEFVELFKLHLTANIIDIGGGDSHFVDALLDKGYLNIWVLDISEKGIEKAKKRLGPRAEMVHWVVSDIIDFTAPVQFDFWHDRAAFHFLTAEDKIYKYVSIAEEAIQTSGYLILGTFSEQGPNKCSGLEIRQYSETSMSARFEVSFERIKCIHEEHETPFKTHQDFLFCSFRKN